MNALWILLLLSAVTLAIAWRAVRGKRRRVHDVRELEAMLLHVDLVAFKNIVDPDEEKFLRSMLKDADFNKVRKERAKVALAYVRVLAFNASVLLSFGQMAKQSENDSIAEAGNALIAEALAIRILAIKVQLKLLVLILIPRINILISDLFDKYEELQEGTFALCRLYQGRNIAVESL